MITTSGFFDHVKIIAFPFVEKEHTKGNDIVDKGSL